MRCDAMRCDAMRCDAMRCDAMRCDAMQCDAMQCNASRLKVVLRNGGCPGLSGGRSDSPHRGIPQQHIMRLWWNQSLASCGWWLVGDPSVRLSVHPVRPHVNTYVRETCFRVSQRRQRRQSSSIAIEAASGPIARHYYICEYVATSFRAENRTPRCTCHRVTLVLSELNIEIFEDENQERILINIAEERERERNFQDPIHEQMSIILVQKLNPWNISC